MRVALRGTECRSDSCVPGGNGVLTDREVSQVRSPVSESWCGCNQLVRLQSCRGGAAGEVSWCHVEAQQRARKGWRWWRLCRVVSSDLLLAPSTTHHQPEGAAAAHRQGELHVGTWRAAIPLRGVCVPLPRNSDARHLAGTTRPSVSTRNDVDTVLPWKICASRRLWRAVANALCGARAGAVSCACTIPGIVPRCVRCAALARRLC